MPVWWLPFSVLTSCFFETVVHCSSVGFGSAQRPMATPEEKKTHDGIQSPITGRVVSKLGHGKK